MPEVPIPGISFRVRLTRNRSGNVVQLIFRGSVMNESKLDDAITKTKLNSAVLNLAREADIEHQVTDAVINQIANDLYKQAGLEEGKSLLPPEFEGGSTSGLNQKLITIVRSLDEIKARLQIIEDHLGVHKEE